MPPVNPFMRPGVIEQGTRLSLSVPPKAQERFADLVKSLPDETCRDVDARRRSSSKRVSGVGALATRGPYLHPGAMAPYSLERLSNCFPGASENEFRRFGDGYVVMLTADAWRQAKNRCFRTHRLFPLPALAAGS
jgi:hypothetical protein